MKIHSIVISTLCISTFLTACNSDGQSAKNSETSAFSERMNKDADAISARFKEAGENLKKQGKLMQQDYEKVSKDVTTSAKSAGDNASDLLNPSGSSKALAQCRQDAEKGDAKAQYTLGLCYRDGNGVAKDVKQAKFWLDKAAKQGHGPAIQTLKDLQ